MAIDKKRAEMARKSQLEGFMNIQLENSREESGAEKNQPGDKLGTDTAGKSGKKKIAPDYIRLDVSGFKEYLLTMASYDSIRSGRTVSVTKYIRNLIYADMEFRNEQYRNAKNI